MMHLRFLNCLIALAAVSIASINCAPKHHATETPTVDFCDLVMNTETYHDRIVRTRAIRTGSGESSRLFHPACNSVDPATWYEWADEPERPKTVWTALREIYENDRRAWVTVVGRFRGPQDLVPGSAAEEALYPQMESRYGHMGCCRFEFVPIRIEAVESVPADVPRLYEK